MADAAEQAFLRVYINTLAAQPLIYKDDYQQPAHNSLKKIPVLQIALPAPPRRKHESSSSSSSSAPLRLTFKSLKPAASYTLDVHPTDTIAAVKALLAAQPHGPPIAAQRLLHKGKALADAKLLREYPLATGDTVNLVLKPVSIPASTPASTPAMADAPPAITLAAPTPTPATARKHQRIPSVVLSPSPSNSSSPSDLPAADITLTLDDAPTPAPPLSAYHAALAAPQFWEDLLAFLQTKLSDADAKTAFEQIFVAIKTSTLTASQAAAIRNAVGITGMAGT
ncbi:ubiquitin-domain-containing protein [Mycena vulgaris]|nr:ubiquitin-domain-containing protein [Mycena vulgaris]